MRPSLESAMKAASAAMALSSRPKLGEIFFGGAFFVATWVVAKVAPHLVALLGAVAGCGVVAVFVEPCFR